MSGVPVSTGRPSPRVITVDGPSGSGKSTLGRRLAGALGLPLIDTGLFYRGVMVAAVRAGIGREDPEGLIRLAQRTVVTLDTDPVRSREEATLVDGTPAGEVLRDPRQATLLSTISSLRGVRDAVLGPQRQLAAHGAVAVGRDCGTVVFPDAPVKIYLEAAQAVRTARRERQLRQAGGAVHASDLEREVTGRDVADSERVHSPLRPAEGAHIIDTGRVGIDEMVTIGLDLARAAGFDEVPAPT